MTDSCWLQWVVTRDVTVNAPLTEVHQNRSNIRQIKQIAVWRKIHLLTEQQPNKRENKNIKKQNKTKKQKKKKQQQTNFWAGQNKEKKVSLQ